MQQLLKPAGRAAGTGIVPPELFLELLVAVDDLPSALDAALGREALPSFARPLKSGRARRSRRAWAWHTSRRARSAQASGPGLGLSMANSSWRALDVEDATVADACLREPAPTGGAQRRGVVGVDRDLQPTDGEHLERDPARERHRARRDPAPTMRRVRPVGQARDAVAERAELASAEQGTGVGGADREREPLPRHPLARPARDDVLRMLERRDEVGGEIEPPPMLGIAVAVAQDGRVARPEEPERHDAVAGEHHVARRVRGARPTDRPRERRRVPVAVHEHDEAATGDVLGPRGDRPRRPVGRSDAELDLDPVVVPRTERRDAAVLLALDGPDRAELRHPARAVDVPRRIDRQQHDVEVRIGPGLSPRDRADDDERTYVVARLGPAAQAPDERGVRLDARRSRHDAHALDLPRNAQRRPVDQPSQPVPADPVVAAPRPVDHHREAFHVADRHGPPVARVEALVAVVAHDEDVAGRDREGPAVVARLALAELAAWTRVRVGDRIRRLSWSSSGVTVMRPDRPTSRPGLWSSATASSP